MRFFVLGIRVLMREGKGVGVAIKAVAEECARRFGDQLDRTITPKWAGTIVRQKLGLATHKSGGVFVIPFSERRKLERLYEKYGITEGE